MKTGVARLGSLVLLASVVLVGCGSPFALRQAQGDNAAFAAGSWVLPEAKGEDLLYVTDAQDNYAYMIALPSGKLVGKLTGFDQPTGDCADSQGNVFIVDSQNSEIREYKHGSKSAFNVLNDRPWIPIGCSVDPITGNLGVANCCGEHPAGNLAIYRKAMGAPKYYQYPGMETYWYCAYDGHGNLFVDGTAYGSYNFRLLEILRGRRQLTSMTLSPGITGDVSLPLLWDGSFLAIASPDSGAIYRFAISGNRGVRVHTTKLDDSSGVYGPFWILSSGKQRTLYAPIVNNSIPSVGVYGYPTGGKPKQDLYDVVAPFGATVSVAT
jgi:hypothetical protein